jgi:TM2 domain-containing membrane protein YozV
MAADPRPPVLYLRSFYDDGVAVIDEGGSKIMRGITRAVAPRTPEQELAEILGHVGPVVAIGKPGEPLPELGAARLYVSHNQWQQKVSDLMQMATLVVIRIGSSAGVLWEIEQALSRIPRQRLVLAFLSGAKVAPELERTLGSVLGQEFADALPQPPLNGWRALAWRDPRRRIGSLVCFAADGTPRPVPVTMWPFWGRDLATAFAFRPSAMPLRRVWRQVFAILDIEAGAMGSRPSRVIAIVLAIGFGYAGAHWFYLGQRRRGWKYVALLPVALAPVFMSLVDAFRFLWVDRATFEARFVAAPLSGTAVSLSSASADGSLRE